METGVLPKGGINNKQKKESKPPSSSPLTHSDAPRHSRTERRLSRDSPRHRRGSRAPKAEFRPADKAAEVVRKKNNPARTPDANVAGSADKLKEKAAKRKASSQTSSSETSSSGPQSRPAKGFASGVKTSLGGDVFDKNKSNRTRARRELGLKTGKAIKSAPGKAARFLSKGLKDTVKSGGTASDGGSVDAPKRGVYNG